MREKNNSQKKENLILVDQKEKLFIKVKEIIRESNKFKRKIRNHVLPDIKHQLLFMQNCINIKKQIKCAKQTKYGY